MPRDKYHNNPSAGMCLQCKQFQTMEHCEECFRNPTLTDKFEREEGE